MDFALIMIVYKSDISTQVLMSKGKNGLANLGKCVKKEIVVAS